MMRFLPLLAASAALLFVGCGPSEKAQSADAASAGAGATAPAGGRDIEITGNDSMKFSVTEIRAKPGEALAVTLTNIGTMPKFSMGHNWVLLASGTDVDTFVADAALAAKTDYVPAKHQSSILASTKLLGPKESDTVRFNAPAQPGRYVFICSFPGHVQVGMKGELIVE